MDIKQLLQARANRKTRLGRPFTNFYESIHQSIAAGELIVNGSLDPKIISLVERSAVISAVTAIEVYYRDLLDFIFHYCNPSFFEPHLKQLFPEKLDITELLDAFRHNIHLFTDKTLEDIWSVTHLIFGSDVVLSQVIEINRDPTLDVD